MTLFFIPASHTSHVAGGHIASVVKSARQDRDATAACAFCATIVRQHAPALGRHLQLCDVPDRLAGPGCQSSFAEKCRNTVPLLTARLPMDVLLADDATIRFKPVQTQTTMVHIGQHLQVPGANL